MQITNDSVRALRGEKNRMDAHTPYHFLHESERQANGEVKRVNTIFLTNSECPFSCVMCDLWKNTLDRPTPKGAIPRQIAKIGRASCRVRGCVSSIDGQVCSD